jgi:tryptophan-rich sensory protein
MKKRVKSRFKKKNWKVLLFCLVAVYATAFVGSIFSSSQANSQWYMSVKPTITPPNFVFPIAWNILFFLIALSLYFSWTNSKKKYKIKLAWVFGINFLLNMLWSVLFFGLKKPNIAFFELIVFWISILLMIFTTWKVDKKSAMLLVPYALWVGFAGILNYLAAFI